MRSPLSQNFTQDGTTVQVELNEDASGWHLELLHEDGTLTVWLAIFSSDAAAMAAFTGAVEEHGLVRLLAMGGEYLPTLH